MLHHQQPPQPPPQQQQQHMHAGMHHDACMMHWHNPVCNGHFGASAAASASLNVFSALSSCEGVTIKGGIQRMTFSYVPQVSNNKSLLIQAFCTYCIAMGSGQGTPLLGPSPTRIC